MNIFGMGTLEILLIMLIAFIFLGPEKMIAGAKKLGQLARDARNLSSDFNTILLDEQNKTTENTTDSDNQQNEASNPETIQFHSGLSNQISGSQDDQSSEPKPKSDPEK
tara:strand:- start:142 stop:468 length:327 start_codon:yes stop_codon:yes gene_type:complete